MTRSRTGYTLRELLVILTVNCLLLGMLLPTVHRVRRAAVEGREARKAAANDREGALAPKPLGEKQKSGPMVPVARGE